MSTQAPMRQPGYRTRCLNCEWGAWEEYPTDWSRQSAALAIRVGLRATQSAREHAVNHVGHTAIYEHVGSNGLSSKVHSFGPTCETCTNVLPDPAMGRCEDCVFKGMED